MIIDAHVHWWKKGFLMVDDFWPFFTANLADSYYVPCGINMTPEEQEKSFLDPDGSALLQRMDDAGIDKSVLLPLDLAIVNQQEAPMDIVSINREYAELAQAHPDRLISFFSMDPRRDNVDRHFLTAVQRHEASLYPPPDFSRLTTLAPHYTGSVWKRIYPSHSIALLPACHRSTMVIPTTTAR